MIGIIGAMDEEISAIKNKLSNIKERKYFNNSFFEGSLNGNEIVLLKSGIGKVNASVSTTILFENYDIDFVINIGTAGGVKKECEVLDIVVSTKVAYHDVNVTAFNYEHGRIPGMPLYFESDAFLVNEIEKILQNDNTPYHKGLIVSGDSFINNKNQIDTITDKFKDSLAVEMEACAIAQVCFIYDKPFLILRSLSDIAGKESHISFENYIAKASINSSNSVEKLIEVINK